MPVAPHGIQVTFKELGVRDGSSPEVSADLETASCNRILLIDWDDRMDAISGLLGYSSLDGSGKLTRYKPQGDFEISGLWANSVQRVNGIVWTDKDTTDFGSVNVFRLAAINVSFRPRPYYVLDDAAVVTGELTVNEFKRYVEIETSAEGDYLTVPVTGFLQFNEGPDGDGGSGDGSSFPGNLGKITCAENYIIRWHQIPDAGLPENTILGCMGRVNKTSFGDGADPRLDFDPGTVLLLGASWRRIFMFTPDGVVPAWTIEYQMKFVPQGHNKLLDIHADPMAFYQVSKDGLHYAVGSIPDGKCIYDEREFSGLFDTTAG